MARYQVSSTSSVMMEWPESGEALALPPGATFEASPYNARVLDLLKARQIRLVEEVKEVVSEVPESPKPAPARKKRARRGRKDKDDTVSKESSS